MSGRISHRRTARERNSIQGITAESWYSWDNGDRLVMERQGWSKESVPQVRVYKWDSADRIISVVQNDNFGEREEELRYQGKIMKIMMQITIFVLVIAPWND